MAKTINPAYVPQTAEQRLGYLVEECGEVLQAAGKSLRWGLDSSNPELPQEKRETNSAWLRRELIDLERAIKYVREILCARDPVTTDQSWIESEVLGEVVTTATKSVLAEVLEELERFKAEGVMGASMDDFDRVISALSEAKGLLEEAERHLVQRYRGRFQIEDDDEFAARIRAALGRG